MYDKYSKTFFGLSAVFQNLKLYRRARRELFHFFEQTLFHTQNTAFGSIDTSLF